MPTPLALTRDERGYLPLHLCARAFVAKSREKHPNKNLCLKRLNNILAMLVEKVHPELATLKGVGPEASTVLASVAGAGACTSASGSNIRAQWYPRISI